MKVFVEQQEYLTVEMFKDEGWEIVSEPSEADLICFIGGADVSPTLYNEANTDSGNIENFDLSSVYLYQQGMLHFIPMVGICRGGQFLNVMNGGKMIQHISGHGLAGTHIVKLSSTINNFDGVSFEATSTHHQEMVPSDVVPIYIEGVAPDGVEEVILYDSDVLCFQPHPEYHNGLACRDVFFNLINVLMVDVSYEN